MILTLYILLGIDAIFYIADEIEGAADKNGAMGGAGYGGVVGGGKRGLLDLAGWNVAAGGLSEMVGWHRFVGAMDENVVGKMTGEDGEHAAVILVAIAPEHDNSLTSIVAREGGDGGFQGARGVRSVGDDWRVEAEELKAPGKPGAVADGGEVGGGDGGEYVGGDEGGEGNVLDLPAGGAYHGYGERGATGEGVDGYAVGAQGAGDGCAPNVRRHIVCGDACLVGDAVQEPAGALGLRGEDEWGGWFDDSALLTGDRFNGCAEVVAVFYF